MYETIYFSLATFIIFSLSFNSFQEALVWSVWIYTSLVCWASWCVDSVCKFEKCLDMSFSNVILATFSFSVLPGFHYVYVGMLDGVPKVSFFFTVFLHFFSFCFSHWVLSNGISSKITDFFSSIQSCYWTAIVKFFIQLQYFSPPEFSFGFKTNSFN